MRIDGKTENQHYVPKMLLRNFCFNNKEQVYVYDKWEKHSFVTNIKNITSENNYNVAKGEKGFIDAEPFFTFIENDTKPVINKLLESKNLLTLDYKDQLVLQFFVASQFIRTRHTRESILHLNKGFAAHIRSMGHDPASVEGFDEFNEDTIKELSLAMLQTVPDLANHLANKDWLLLKTDKLNPFYISDNPVGFHNDNDFGPYGNIGFALRGIQIYCPLTPEFALGMYCPSILQEGFESKKQLESTMAQQKALALLSSNPQQRIKADLIVKTSEKLINEHATMKDSLEMLDKIDSGEAILQTSENITFMNYIQVRFSQRYIISNINNFTLVERILLDHPDWKIGLMPKF